MLEDLKKSVCEANLELVKKGLVIYTWGNASGICRERGLVIIKPSGVDYDELTPDHLSVIDLDGNIVEGDLKPSSDTPTHLQIYRAFPKVGGVVHTHSRWATIFSQAGLAIPPLGTTHADYYYGEIPCTRRMFPREINGEYEKETGRVIVETFKNKNPMEVPGVIVSEHGPFSWGRNPQEAVYHAVILEEVAMMAFNTIALKHYIQNFEYSMTPDLLNKHFFRKHGANSYYGQITCKGD
jgi:L-ribulose-5-phosphate 4-epimerase